MRMLEHSRAALPTPSPVQQPPLVAMRAPQRPPVHPHRGAATSPLPHPAARPARSAAKDASAHSCITTGTEVSTASDRKSTRLNSSHSQISYAVFCLKKKKMENLKMELRVVLSST